MFRVRRRIHWMLLFGFLLSQWPTQQVIFVDEPDNMLSGWLVSEGEVPYRDFFSHHAPFPYFYSAFFHVGIGKHFVIQRFSVALFGTLAFAAIIQRVRRDPAPLFYEATLLLIGLWFFYCRTFWHFLVLADNYVGYSLLVVFVVLLHALWSRIPFSRTDHALLGLFTFTSLASNPQAVFPVLASFVFYVWLLLQDGARGLKSLWPAVVGGGVPSLLLLGFFAWHDCLDLLWKNVVEFNAQVYAKYLDTATNFLGVIGYSASTGYELLHLSRWDFSFRFFEPIPLWGDDYWAYLGFLGRLCLFAIVAYSFYLRKFLCGVMLFSVGACSLSRDLSFLGGSPIPWWFHVQHFRLLCLFCMCLLMVLLCRRAVASSPSASCCTLFGSLCISLLCVLISVNGLVAVRTVQAVMADGVRATVARNACIDRWDNFLGWQVAVCTEIVGENGRVAAYPNGCYIAYLGDYSSASHFNFFLPWTAERPEDRQQILADLDQGLDRSTAFWIHRSDDVWGVPVEDYCREMLMYLDQHYIRVAQDIYVSAHSRVVQLMTQAEHAGLLNRELMNERSEPQRPSENGQAADYQRTDTQNGVQLSLNEPENVVAIEITYRLLVVDDTDPIVTQSICAGMAGRFELCGSVTPGAGNRKWILWPMEDCSTVYFGIVGGRSKLKIDQVAILSTTHGNANESESARLLNEDLQRSFAAMRSFWSPVSAPEVKEAVSDGDAAQTPQDADPDVQ